MAKSPILDSKALPTTADTSMSTLEEGRHHSPLQFTILLETFLHKVTLGSPAPQPVHRHGDWPAFNTKQSSGYLSLPFHSHHLKTNREKGPGAAQWQWKTILFVHWGRRSVGQWDSLVSKGTCHQVWQPMLNPWASQGRGKSQLLRVPLWPRNACCAMHIHVQTHRLYTQKL